MEVNQEKVRVATLNVIKHLINSCDSELEDKKPLLISGLNIVLLENNLRVNWILPTQHYLASVIHYLRRFVVFSIRLS